MILLCVENNTMGRTTIITMQCVLKSLPLRRLPSSFRLWPVCQVARFRLLADSVEGLIPLQTLHALLMCKSLRKLAGRTYPRSVPVEDVDGCSNENSKETEKRRCPLIAQPLVHCRRALEGAAGLE